jgi:hypothetical protein
LQVEYSAFGIARAASIALPFTMAIVGAANVNGCPPG